nr:hypothetical protein [uncultured Flavobacterium sp.]
MNTKDSNDIRKNDSNNKKMNSSGNTGQKSEIGKKDGKTAIKKSPAKK